MKLDLSQWNPFKFFRKAPEEQAAPSTTSTALAVPGEPEWPTRSEAMRRLMPDPAPDAGHAPGPLGGLWPARPLVWRL